MLDTAVIPCGGLGTRLQPITRWVPKELLSVGLRPVLYWALDEIADHWDELVMRSFIVNQADRELYQQGPLSLIRRPAELIRLFTGVADELPDGTVMYCGTVSVHGAIRPASELMVEIEDPVLRRSIRHTYRVHTLPIAQ